jgi:toxin ParE1/3/4
MYTYILSNVAKQDLIRIYQFGEQRFGINQAEIYFDTFFTHFKINSEVIEIMTIIGRQELNDKK